MKYSKETFILIGILLFGTLIFSSCNNETIDTREDTGVLNGNGLKVINYRSSNNGKKSISKNNKSTFTGTTIAVFSDELAY